MSKYITLQDLKNYGQALDPTLTNDDVVLQSAIERAEMEFDGHCGQGFDEQTLTLTAARQPFVDAYGWLWLTAIERVPVTSVIKVQVRDILASASVWTDITYGVDDVILPLATVPPDPNAGKVRILSNNPRLAPHATGSILVRWSYKGGYSVIPESLKAMILRLSWWIYKLREAPLGRVATLELGIMEIPLSMPKDILFDMNLWKRGLS